MDRNYRIFQRYMEISKKKYNADSFLNDDMYFAKIWRPHRKAFASICKQYDCTEAYLALNDRAVKYEMKLLNFRAPGLSEQEYQKEYLDIIRIFI